MKVLFISFMTFFYAANGLSQKKLISPFELQIDPMERLLLINIENDPDSVYIGFEPQVFDDEETGTGLLVIAWRRDGKVDVFHQPGLSPDPEKFNIAGNGLADMAVREMNGAIFEINEKGVQSQILFTDFDGRLVELNIEEHSKRTRKPFGLLAPMGQAAVNPSALPLVLLHEFYFVRRSKTDIIVKINNRYHKPDKLPMPIDFSRMYFSRYSPDPLIVKLNPEFEGKLNPLPEPVNNRIILGDTIYELTEKGPYHKIKSISRTHKGHTVKISFTPAFPNLNVFSGESAEGIFEIAGNPAAGKVRGLYYIRNFDDKLYIELLPSAWMPYEKKLSLRFLYRIAPVFKNWPSTYRWKAELYRDENNQLNMNSKWERIK